MTRHEREFLKSNTSLVEAPLHLESAFIPSLIGKKPHHSVFTFIQTFDLHGTMDLHASVFPFVTTGSKFLCVPHIAPV